MKKINNKGISLIVLIITVIVVIILAAAVILTLSKNNPIESAKEATFKEDIRAYQDELNMYIAKEYQQTQGQRDWKITATGYEKDGSKQSVYTYLSNFKKKYEGKIAIKDDLIAYVGFDDKEKSWLVNSGIYMSKKFIIQYINEYGEKLFPDEEVAELDIEYTFYAKEKEGYMPLQTEISGIAAENTTVTFEYCKISNDFIFKGLDSSGNETEETSNIVAYTVAGLDQNCTDTWVAIPREYKSKPVTQVKAGAFYGSKQKVKKIVIEDNIESIGGSAFEMCNSIISARLNTKNEITSSFIFQRSSLKEVILGKNISLLPNCIFGDCSSLEKVMFCTEKNIGITSERCFERCSSLKEISLNSENSKYIVEDGILYTNNYEKLVIYPVGKIGEEFTIDKRTKEIGAVSFCNNINLKKINILSNVESIGNSAFAICNIIYANVDCKSDLSNSYIFQNCSKLKEVKLGKNISYMAYCIFSRCTSLEKIEFNTEKDIYIHSIRSFENCNNLTQIVVNTDNKKYLSYQGILYTKNKEKLVIYPVGKVDEYFVFDSNTKEIGSFAFAKNKYLKELNIPSTVEVINNSAFRESVSLERITVNAKNINSEYVFGTISNLTEITIGNNVTNIGAYTFRYFNKNNYVTYNGTIEKWNQISKSSSWNAGTTITKVICTDGDILL